MNIPWQELKPETLEALIDEYVTRDGTDYGQREATRETKIEQVKRLLASGKAKIVFDPETETCDIREAIC
jgi:hypothetical protein